MTMPWIMAWQISIRSNGSLCNWGSLVRCNVALSSSGSVSTPCCSLWVGMNLSGASGRGSRPRACLMEIYQVETELRKTSFPGSPKSSRARVECSGASAIIRRKVQVSRRILIALRHKKRPLFQVAKVQRTQAEPGTYPLQDLSDVEIFCPVGWDEFRQPGCSFYTRWWFPLWQCAQDSGRDESLLHEC